MGYFPEQLQALADTLNRSDADVIISATPSDLSRLVDLDKPVVRVFYDYAEADSPGLGDLVDNFLRQRRLGG